MNKTPFIIEVIVDEPKHILRKTKTRIGRHEFPPFPGTLGEQIFDQVSKQAWSMWLSHQTMLINEYRLSLIDSKAREFLQEEMTKFFFGEGSDAPSGYTPVETKTT